MKKTAYAVISLVVLFSTAVISLLCNSANANPNWRPWENASTPPIITIHSPVESKSYISTEVVLSFTVTKPADYFTSNGKIDLVAYFVDTNVFNLDTRKENVVEVQDLSDAEHPIPSFDFSFNLTGLKDGPHTVEVYAEGHGNGTGMGISMAANFITYTLGEESQSESLTNPTPTATPEPTLEPESLLNIESFPTSLVIASAIPSTVVLVGLGLLLYGIKRKR